MSSCDHLNYDEYFERCPDCNLEGVTIHKNECGSTDVEETDSNVFECNDCGFVYFEQMYTSCDQCENLTVPIQDITFRGICSGCGFDTFAA